VSVALIIQHAKCMNPVILWSVACPSVTYFSTLSHKNTIFGKKVTEHKMCVLVFSETFLIARRIQHDIVINALTYSCKVIFILFRF